MRGQGRVRQPALAFKTIRNYLAYLMPVLAGWADPYASLREVTRKHLLRERGDLHHHHLQRRR
jgi:hypothetical protein